MSHLVSRSFALLAISIVLASTALTLLHALRVANTPHDPPSGALAKVQAARERLLSALWRAPDYSINSEQGPRVSVVLHDLDVAENDVGVQMLIGLPQDAVNSLNRGGRWQLYISDRLRSDIIEEREVAVEDLDFGAFRHNFRASVRSSSSQFPNDEYRTDLEVVLVPPPVVEMEMQSNEGGLNVTVGYPDATFGLGLLDTSWSAAYAVTDVNLGPHFPLPSLSFSLSPDPTADGGDPLSQSATTLTIIAKRDPLQRTLTWGLALSPVLLLVIVSHHLWVAFRRGTNDMDPLIAVGTAIAIVAVVPLREVLVPPDIPVLTTLDYALALQVIAFISAACVGYALASSRTH